MAGEGTRLVRNGSSGRSHVSITKRKSLANFTHDIWKGELAAEARWFACKAALFAGLGGFLVGWDIGAVASVILQLTSQFNLDSVGKELVVSTMLLGAVIGSTVSGTIADRIGRRNAIMVSSCIFCCSSIVAATAQSITVLFAARLVLGVGVATATTADVLYLTEVAPPEWRGALVSCNELMTTLGILSAYVAGALINSVPGGWRYIFSLPALLSTMQFFGMLGMPKSPRWLLQQGFREDARDALRRSLVDEGRVELELQHALDDLRKSGSNLTSDNNGASAPARSLCANAAPELAIAVTLMIFQQCVGNANVCNYAPVILTNAGLKDEAALLSTVGLGALKTCMTVLAIVQLETMGRRPLLMLGSCVCACSMVMLGVAFSYSTPNAQLAVAGLLLFVSAWSGSFGPLGWLLSAELFSDEARGRAMSIASTVNWSANLLVSLTFLTLSEAVGQNVAFFIYAGVATAAFFFVLGWVPETMGKSPRAIQQAVRSGWCCGDRSANEEENEDDDAEIVPEDSSSAHSADSTKIIRAGSVVGSIQF